MQNHSRSLVPQFLEKHGWDQCDRDRDAKQDYDDPDEPYLRRGIVTRKFKILVLAVVLRVFLTAHSITFRFFVFLMPDVPAFVLYHLQALYTTIFVFLIYCCNSKLIK